MRVRKMPKYIIKDNQITGSKVKVVVHYRTKSGQTLDWVCDYDRLDHVIEVCYAKELDIVGVEQL